MGTATVPAAVAVRVSGWLTAPSDEQGDRGTKVPDDGVTCTPPGVDATCQWTGVAARPAGATPRWTWPGVPAAMEMTPLGLVKPTAGSRSAPNDGGLSAAVAPHEGDGEADRVKSSVPPLRSAAAGSQGRFQPAGEGEPAFAGQAPGAAAGAEMPVTLRARM